MPSNKLRTFLSVGATLLLLGAIPLSTAAVNAGKRTAVASQASKKTQKNQPAKSPPASDADFSTLVDAYFDDYFKFNPSQGTEYGLHQYDGQVEDFSADGRRKEAAMERSYRAKFKAIDPARLNKINRLDREVLLANIDGQLLELEVLQTWKRNPDYYSSAVTAGVFSLIKRNYAPIEQRMQSVIAREEAIPAALEAAKANMVLTGRIPRVYAQVCQEQLPGVLDFFVSALPDALKTVTNETLRQDFAKANMAAIAALTDYKKYVDDLVGKEQCHGTFALGAEHYAEKLRYEQMVDTPLDKLLEDGYAELRRQQKEFTELAAKVSPNESVSQYFTGISKDHPKADQVLSSVSSLLDEIRTFCIDKNIVTIPSKEQVKVEETPPFERALTFASMDTPGPYETNAKEAYYYVTLPEPGWTAERTEQHLRNYCYPDLINTSVHEAYPGHYVQFLWSKQFPSKTRKLIVAGSNVEGWAHYCEQMMLEEGLHKDDAKLKMVQLHDALLRCCRYIVAIEMHTKNMSIDQAIDFFMKEGYMERANAEREAKRGAMDPTYLVYTLGKMEILALRDEYRKLKKESYTLKAFHDRFLKSGCIPLKIVRAEMLEQSLPLTPATSVKVP